MFNSLESPTRSTQHSPIHCLFAVKRNKKVKTSKSQCSCLTPLASPWWLLSYFHECPCSIVSFPHIIHNLEEPERKKEPPTTSIQKRDFSIALAGKRKKKERPGPRVSMVTLALLLFVLGRRCNKSAGREMTGQGV